jgi:hypothetical protein
MSSQLESIYSDELILLAETLGEVKTRTEKLEGEFSTHAKPLEAATNALSAALSGIKALQFHVLDNNLGALSARVEEMRKAVDEQVGVIALELKKADETNAAKAGAEAEALRSEIVALQSQLGSLVTQFGQQLERVEFAAKEEAKKLQLIPGPAGAAGASLNPRGTFIDGETYNRLDVVSWLGSSYIAAVDGVTEKPSKNSNQWQTLASRGGGGAGGVGDFGSLAGVAQINQGGTGQTTRALALNALLPDQAGSTQYMLLTDGSGTVSWGAQPVAGLPSQTSNSGRLLTTNGSTASWSNAVTVSGSNATVGGTLTVSGLATANGGTSIVTGGFTQTQTGNEIRFSRNAFNYISLDGGTSANLRFLATTSTAGDTGILNLANTQVQVLPTTASTTTSSGALVVGNGTSGGLGVGGNITLGGGVNIAGSASDPLPAGTSGVWTASGSGLRINSAGYTFASLTGTSVSDAKWTLNATTASTAYNNGALVVSGGVGIAGALYSQQNTNGILSGTYFENASTGNAATIRHRLIAGASTCDIEAYGSGHATFANRLRFGTSNGQIDFIPSGVNTVGINNNTVSILASTASTGTSSGALVVSGGVGVAGAIVTGGIVRCGGSNGLSLGSDTGNIRIDTAGPAGVEFRGLSSADTVTGFTMREMALIDGTTAPSTRAGYATIYVDSADGDLKVKFGDGTVKTIATDS